MAISISSVFPIFNNGLDGSPWPSDRISALGPKFTERFIVYTDLIYVKSAFVLQLFTPQCGVKVLSLLVLTSNFEATRGLFWNGPRNFEPLSDDEDDT
ncbi:hypothetical protein AVEN_61045-1 [Araneus ventricosus]|uniref:Uncharacterized protein n=1 Tax=Araneus ventricosus TaxID=182803 RepID=A0A4Y2DUS4_ARAVE|nr:hypothetical protein AVEN_61045-1 [Araneus ventricosus]